MGVELVSEWAFLPINMFFFTREENPVVNTKNW